MADRHAKVRVRDGSALRTHASRAASILLRRAPPMLVYGSPGEDVDLEDSVRRLMSRTRTILGGRGAARADELRTLSIAAGQIEQAMTDAYPSFARSISALGDAAASAARALYLCWRGDTAAQVEPHLQSCIDNLRRVEVDRGLSAPLRVPAGFAYDSVFPEQYFEAAQRWISEPHRLGRRALVIGIRSIGTTLSSAVTAVLERGGWHVRRVTVRPEGHPFHRTLDIPREVVAGIDEVLVVDEGPGLSGSSFAAVGEALGRAGVAPAAITLLPSHANEPGSAASDEIRSYWLNTKKIVVPLEAVRFEGRLFGDFITRKLAGEGARFEDLGGGGWRRVAGLSEDEWTFGRFERSKFLLTSPDGSRKLVKFGGLAPTFSGSEEDLSTGAERLAESLGSSAEIAAGFVARPWIEGRASDRSEVSAALARAVGSALGDARCRTLSPAEVKKARERLAEMLVCNAAKALGDVGGARAAQLASGCDREVPLPASFDGRAEPADWIRTEEGRLVKVPGHVEDHTLAGVQPITWDLGGAMVEWKLDARAQLVRALLDGYGGRVEPRELRFHRAAYAALKMGQAELSDEAAAYAFYRDALERAL